MGLNWLRTLHARDVNGILADEMGLGKTVRSRPLLLSLSLSPPPSVSPSLSLPLSLPLSFFSSLSLPLSPSTAFWLMRWDLGRQYVPNLALKAL